MIDDRPTPRASGAYSFWSSENEKLAVRLSALAIELRSDGLILEADDAEKLAERARDLAVKATAWAFKEPSNPERVAEMNEIIQLHRRAFELLTDGSKPFQSPL